ncbi:dnaJ homolog subfamily C member 21 [Trichonephila clavipes]|nr:dnaJ homolog subfamily C member 21 [Trichonephila clavipes]
MADLFCRATGGYQIQHRSEETPAKSFLVCVRLRQRSLLLLTGLFTHKSLRDDKNLHRLTEATETFQLIQQAYETLIDPQERAWYDRHKEEILKGVSEEVYKDDCLNVYQYFNSSCFKGYNDDEKGFYTVFRQVFEKIATEDKPFIDSDDEIEVPYFGYSYSSYKEVVRDFYAYWQSYCTSKSYSWVDQFSLSEARKSGVGRQVIRAMEKDNKKLRDQHKKARNEEVRALVAFVKKRDKRVQAHKYEVRLPLAEMTFSTCLSIDSARGAYMFLISSSGKHTSIALFIICFVVL